MILRSSRFQISNLFLATTTLGASRQKVASGVNFEPPFLIEVITGSGSNSISLPTFPWTTWWKKIFHFQSKLRAWQCRLTFYKMAAVTSSRWVFQEMKKTPLANRCPTSNPEMCWNPSSCLGARASTDTHRDRQTHTHRQGPLRYDCNILSHSEMTEYKKYTHRHTQTNTPSSRTHTHVGLYTGTISEVRAAMFPAPLWRRPGSCPETARP